MPDMLVASIDGDQPLLDIGMNSMQLTLFVSIIRAEVPVNFSIGNLLLLHVISINNIALMLCNSPAAAAAATPPNEIQNDPNHLVSLSSSRELQASARH